MMGRIQREQMVTYVLPPFKMLLDEQVEAERAKGKRITLSSLAEELMLEGWEVRQQRQVGERKPTRKARRGKLTSV